MHFPCYDLALADTDVSEHANCFDHKRKHLKTLFSGNMKPFHVSVDNMQNRINKNDPSAVRDNAISLTNKFHVAVRRYSNIFITVYLQNVVRTKNWHTR